MNIDADGFSVVVDLGGVRREKGWMGGHQCSEWGEAEEASHTAPGAPQTLATLTLALSSSATCH